MLPTTGSVTGGVVPTGESVGGCVTGSFVAVLGLVGPVVMSLVALAVPLVSGVPVVSGVEVAARLVSGVPVVSGVEVAAPLVSGVPVVSGVEVAAPLVSGAPVLGRFVALSPPPEELLVGAGSSAKALGQHAATRTPITASMATRARPEHGAGR
ncbi:MAG TPA: hypothetical protein VE780_05650 [Thermoleophilaceae bacterium]|nr:hypothetical protein [Thermoleophilaceae bacterium]